MSLAIYQMSARMWPAWRKCCSVAAHPSPGWTKSMWVSQQLDLLLRLLKDGSCHPAPPDNHLSSGAACAPVNRHSHYQRRAGWRANRIGSRCRGSCSSGKELWIVNRMGSRHGWRLHGRTCRRCCGKLGRQSMPACVGVAMANVQFCGVDCGLVTVTCGCGCTSTGITRRRMEPMSMSSSAGCIAMFDSAPISQSTFGIAAVQSGKKKDEDRGST